MSKVERIERLEREVFGERRVDWVFFTEVHQYPSLSDKISDVAERSDKQGLIVDAILKHLGLEFHQVEDESVNGVNRYNELRPVDKKK